MTDISTNLSVQAQGTVNFGDLVMLNGDLVLTSDADARGTNPILQDILLRLRTFQGEFFMDTSLGVPWYQLVFAYGTANSNIDTALQNVILSTPGVQLLTAWSVSQNRTHRALTISFAVSSVAGQISYSGALAEGTGG